MNIFKVRSRYYSALSGYVTWFFHFAGHPQNLASTPLSIRNIPGEHIISTQNRCRIALTLASIPIMLL